MMTAPDRGNKHTCASCAIRFYDLNKRPATCPQCKQKISLIAKAPRTRRLTEKEKMIAKS